MIVCRLSLRLKGFTLIELLITLAILGVLATLITPVVQIEMQRQREAELRASLRDIRKAIDVYKTTGDQGNLEVLEGKSGYPKDLDALVKGVKDIKNPEDKKIFFLRRIPLDPMVSGTLTMEQKSGGSYGWGLRSYESDPEDPQAGSDVFDVYSTSNGVGLNGIPYRKW
jgi:general secretion pathway protein G